MIWDEFLKGVWLFVSIITAASITFFVVNLLFKFMGSKHSNKSVTQSRKNIVSDRVLEIRKRLLKGKTVRNLS